MTKRTVLVLVGIVGYGPWYLVLEGAALVDVKLGEEDVLQVPLPHHRCRRSFHRVGPTRKIYFFFEYSLLFFVFDNFRERLIALGRTNNNTKCWSIDFTHQNEPN
jgi:hypothetical protein